MPATPVAADTMRGPATVAELAMAHVTSTPVAMAARRLATQGMAEAILASATAETAVAMPEPAMVAAITAVAIREMEGVATPAMAAEIRATAAMGMAEWHIPYMERTRRSRMATGRARAPCNCAIVCRDSRLAM
jgi:hypothetical protein